jgi:hypothetical protein
MVAHPKIFTSRRWKYFKNFRFCVGRYSYLFGTRAARLVFNSTRKFAEYWRIKYSFPQWHSGSHGGYREGCCSVDPEHLPIVDFFVRKTLMDNPR